MPSGEGGMREVGQNGKYKLSKKAVSVEVHVIKLQSIPTEKLWARTAPQSWTLLLQEVDLLYPSGIGQDLRGQVEVPVWPILWGQFSGEGGHCQSKLIADRGWVIWMVKRIWGERQYLQFSILEIRKPRLRLVKYLAPGFYRSKWWHYGISSGLLTVKPDSEFQIFPMSSVYNLWS